MKFKKQTMLINILVTYRLEHPMTGEIIEDGISAAYEQTVPRGMKVEIVPIELMARKWIATTLIERGLAGETQFAYDQPAPWVTLTSLSVQWDDTPIQFFPPEKLMTPKQLAMLYQRKHLKEFWDAIGLNYKVETDVAKKAQH